MSEHYLKTYPKYFDDVASGVKPFEVRKDDRTPRFEVEDVLHLQEYEPFNNGHYTGRETTKRVTYVLRDSQFCKRGYCVLGIAPALPIPLNLEELYKMDGELVFCRGLGERAGYDGYYTVCVDEESVGTFAVEMYDTFEDYGKTWLAYPADQTSLQ